MLKIRIEYIYVTILVYAIKILILYYIYNNRYNNKCLYLAQKKIREDEDQAPFELSCQTALLII